MKDSYKKESPLLTLTSLGGGSNSFSYAGAGDAGLSDSFWFATFDSSANGNTEAYSIAVDNNDGSVYICGTTNQANSSIYSQETMFVAKYDKAGLLQWQRALGGTNPDHARDIAVDNSGNVYITGYSDNDNYTGGSIFNIDVTSDGSSAWTFSGTDRNGPVSGNNPTINIYVNDRINFNINASGHPFAIQTVPGVGGSQVPSSNGPGYGVSGNGTSNGTVTFYTESVSSGTYYYQCGNHSSMGGSVVVDGSNYAGYGQEDVIIIKYNSSGNLLWQRTLGGSQYERCGNSLKIKGSSIYVGLYGWFSASGTTTNYSFGFAKFDTSGNLQLKGAAGNPNTSWGFYQSGIDVDDSGNIYVSGTNTSTTPYGYYSQPCGVIVKWNSSGTWQWTYTISEEITQAIGRQQFNLYDVVVDGDGSNVYASGTFRPKGNWGYGNSTAQWFIIKFDPSGTGGNPSHGGGLKWCKVIHVPGTMTTETGDLVMDSEGNLLLCGQVYSIQTGNTDFCIIKINGSTGGKIWTRIINNTYGKPGQTATQTDQARGITVDSDDNFYVTGRSSYSGQSAMIAKLPGDGSLYDTSGAGSSGTGIPITYGARFVYKEVMNESGYNFSYDTLSISGTSDVITDSTYCTGFTPQISSRTSNLAEDSSVWANSTVGIITDITKPDSAYDYSFLDEVHYGDGLHGSLGSQTYHYSGDGTMPAISLGSDIQNWDMFFECYISGKDRGVSNNEWVICNNGFSSTNGFLLGFYYWNFVNQMSIAHPSGAYGIYSSVSSAYDSLNSTTDDRPMVDQWNWFKLEWRGGSSFKIWHKNCPTKTYTQRYSTTSSVYSGTDWNYLLIGQGKSDATDSPYSPNQFYGRIKNFGLNVNSNVVDL